MTCDDPTPVLGFGVRLGTYFIITAQIVQLCRGGYRAAIDSSGAALFTYLAISAALVWQGWDAFSDSEAIAASALVNALICVTSVSAISREARFWACWADHLGGLVDNQTLQSVQVRLVSHSVLVGVVALFWGGVQLSFWLVRYPAMKCLSVSTTWAFIYYPTAAYGWFRPLFVVLLCFAMFWQLLLLASVVKIAITSCTVPEEAAAAAEARQAGSRGGLHAHGDTPHAGTSKPLEEQNVDSQMEMQGTPTKDPEAAPSFWRRYTNHRALNMTGAVGKAQFWSAAGVLLSAGSFSAAAEATIAWNSVGVGFDLNELGQMFALTIGAVTLLDALLPGKEYY